MNNPHIEANSIVLRKSKAVQKTVHHHYATPNTNHVHRTAPGSSYTCHYCGIKGHWIEECPTKSLPADDVCFNCKVGRHPVCQCPQSSNPVQKHPPTVHP
eukprot:32543_1